MPFSFLASRLPLRKFSQRLRWRVERSRLARVTIVNQFHPPDFAATGQFISDLSARLAALGLQNLVLTGQPGYAFRRMRAERIEFHYNRCIRRTAVSRFWPERIRGRVVNSLLFCLRTLVRLLRQARRGDLLLVTTEPAYLPVVGWLAHLLTGAPYVVVLYDIYPDIAVSLGVVSSSHPLVRLWRVLQEQALMAAREIVVLSSTMATHLHRYYSAVSTPVSVIPSWADPRWIAPLPREFNRFAFQHGLGSSFVVLYSGNQGRCHDLLTLIEAAEQLRDQPLIRFLIVGGGAQHNALVQRAQERELQNLIFLPYQEQEQMPEVLACADLAIVSLLECAEGQVAPSKLYGHLAAATPVAALCAPHSYLVDELKRGGCGRAFANGDSAGLSAWIAALAADPAEAQRLGAAGRTHLLATATPDLVVQAYAALLSRHLPLSEKSFAPPLLQHHRPVHKLRAEVDG